MLRWFVCSYNNIMEGQHNIIGGGRGGILIYEGILTRILSIRQYYDNITVSWRGEDAASVLSVVLCPLLLLSSLWLQSTQWSHPTINLWVLWRLTAQLAAATWAITTVHSQWWELWQLLLYHKGKEMAFYLYYMSSVLKRNILQQTTADHTKHRNHMYYDIYCSNPHNKVCIIIQSLPLHNFTSP